MTARIMEDCLGGDLYSQLKEKVKNNKINLEFDFGNLLPVIFTFVVVITHIEGHNQENNRTAKYKNCTVHFQL